MVTEKIIKGPSKSQFLESFQRHNSGAETFVEFTTESNEKLSGVIYALEHNGEAGNCFYFTGRFYGRMLHGYYNVKTRNGWIQVSNIVEETAETVKMADMDANIAATVFMKLNPMVVAVLKEGFCDGADDSLSASKTYYTTIVTDVEPKDLVYPEGWYYDHGSFTNRATSSDGFYTEIRMIKESKNPGVEGEFWGKTARYSTYSE